MSSAGVQNYRNVAAHTADRGEILLALYDGAIRYAETARQAILRQDAAAKGYAVDSLLAILLELTMTLDHKRDPDLCSKLTGLYNYFIARVQVAGLRMDATPMDEVLGQLQGLRETWAKAVLIARNEGVI